MDHQLSAECHASFVDFKGYSSINKFYLKEVCFYEIDTKILRNYLIETNKIKYLKNYAWLVKYYHKIPKNYGFLKFFKFLKLISKQNIVFL